LQAKVSQGGLLLAPKSVLLLEGPDISIKNLRVDGALVVRAVRGAKVVLDGLTVSNQGWTWTPLDKVSHSTACFSVCMFLQRGLTASNRPVRHRIKAGSLQLRISCHHCEQCFSTHAALVYEHYVSAFGGAGSARR
jgi:hypothetical protein